MSNDLLAIPKELQTSVVLLDAVDGTVEVSDLALSREHLSPQNISHTTLVRSCQ